MPLVQAKCTNCGANLEIDNTKDAAICPYCGTAFIVEKAINNYNTTNQIHANTVNIYGGNPADFVIRGGVLVKYNGAATEAVIPSGVKIIGGENSYSGAFRDCVGITSVVIPDSVQEIRDGAFYGCAGLTTVTMPNSLQKIGDSTFCNCSSLTAITIPDSVREIGKSAFYGCSSLASVIIPNSVQKVGDFAFYECSSLISVTIPNSVQEICSCAFQGCSSLRAVAISNSVREIDREAFMGCKSLTSVTIPNSVREIKNGAFCGCSALTSVTIPNSVQVIAEGAFCGCRSLASINIPSSVRRIDESAFTSCDALYKVKLDGEPSLSLNSFDSSRVQIVEASKACKRKNSDAFECLKRYRPRPNIGGCYVATAVYGSYDCPEVWTLRRFRDDTLDRTWYGRAFIHTYYAVSPTLVRWFGACSWFQRLFRAPLDRLVARLHRRGVQDTPYRDKY